MNPPKIEPFSFPKDVREGMRARVFCSVIEGDSPVSILWTKGDEALPTDSDASVQSTDEFSSLLIFKKVSARHNGNYTCIVSNAAAVVQHTAELLVHVPPHWIAEPNDVSVLLGHRVELACRADGYPQPNITWLRGEGRLPGDYRNIHHFGSHLLLSENGSLIIDKVKKKDDGYYLCQATNGIGSGLSKVVYLTINVPAYFEVKHRNQTAKKGDQVQLQCEAWGDAPLRMRWNRNDSRIEYEDDQRFITTTHQRENSILAELILKTATKSDSALFTCFATNAFGHDEASIQLFIEEKPLAPTNVQLASSTSRTAALVWTPSGDGNSQILRHVVQIKKIADEWNEKTTTNITVESGSPKGTVFHLLPGVTYNLRVIAENRLGRSLPSEHIEMTTNEEGDKTTSSIDSSILPMH
uniref:Down syndrome cell adhesion molecule n=1 Tax=Strigamia maritima TaxID=126957 RepID=T1JJC1_STRMM